MKRLVFLLSLVLLLALAACADTPDNQELLPTDTAATPTPVLEAPVEGAPSGEQVVASLAGTSWEWVETTTPTETSCVTSFIFSGMPPELRSLIFQ